MKTVFKLTIVLLFSLRLFAQETNPSKSTTLISSQQYDNEEHMTNWDAKRVYVVSLPAMSTALGDTESISIKGTARVNVTNSSIAATQSGTWNIGSITTLPAITGTVQLPDTETVGIRGTPNVNVINSSVAVTGTFWQTTQPVSVSSIPTHTVVLPDTESIGIRGSINAVQSGTWNVTANVGTVVLSDTESVSIKGSIPVTGTFWQATQPVSGTFWQTTQPVSIASVPTHTVTLPDTETVGIRGTPNVNVSNSSLAVTQSGTWNVGAITTLPAITGTVQLPDSETIGIRGTPNVNVSNSTLAVTKSGTWSDTTTIWKLIELENAVDQLEGYVSALKDSTKDQSDRILSFLSQLRNSNESSSNWYVDSADSPAAWDSVAFGFTSRKVSIKNLSATNPLYYSFLPNHTIHGRLDGYNAAGMLCSVSVEQKRTFILIKKHYEIEVE